MAVEQGHLRAKSYVGVQLYKQHTATTPLPQKVCNKMSKHATGKANINIVQSGTPLNNNDRHGALFELPSPSANGRSAVSATASQDETAITSFEVPPVVAAAAVPRDGSSADDVQTDVVSIFVVPTKGAVDEKISEKTVMIDAEHISGENLKKLKVQDPFLYYSIPAAVRNAAVRHTEVRVSLPNILRPIRIDKPYPYLPPPLCR